MVNSSRLGYNYTIMITKSIYCNRFLLYGRRNLIIFLVKLCLCNLNKEKTGQPMFILVCCRVSPPLSCRGEEQVELNLRGLWCRCLVSCLTHTHSHTQHTHTIQRIVTTYLSCVLPSNAHSSVHIVQEHIKHSCTFNSLCVNITTPPVA